MRRLESEVNGWQVIQIGQSVGGLRAQNANDPGEGDRLALLEDCDPDDCFSYGCRSGAAYLLFGLLYVILPPPRDKKALGVLKLRPQVTSQIIGLIKSWSKGGANVR